MEDPRHLPQTTPVRTAYGAQIIASAAGNFSLNWEDFLKSTEGLAPADRLHALLNKAAFQFNKKNKYRAEPFWLERIRKRVKAGLPPQLLAG